MNGDLRLCVAYLRRHGMAIGEAARSGDALATKIVDCYKLYRDRQVQSALDSLAVAIEEHKRSRATPPFTLPEDDCEHDDVAGASQCPDCGITFVYCHGCSEAGGAERGIYHAGPARGTSADGAP